MNRFTAWLTMGWLSAAGLVLAWGATAEAQYCQGNVDCGPGWVCQAGSCVEGTAVGVEGEAQVGGVGVQGQAQVTVPAPPQQPPPQQVQVQAQPAYPPQQQVYAQPQPQQPVRYRERPRWGLIGSGIGLFAGGYVVNILVTGIGAAVIAGIDSVSGDTATLADEFFYTGLVPVAGPWIQLGIMQYAGYDGWAPWLIIDGLLQAGGLTMIILGAVLTEREAVYADLGDGVELGFTPLPGGMRASLTF